MNAFTHQQRRNTRNEPHEAAGITTELKVGLWRLREGPDGSLLFERRHGTGLLYHAVDSVAPEPATSSVEDRVAALEARLAAAEQEAATLRADLAALQAWRAALVQR